MAGIILHHKGLAVLGLGDRREVVDLPCLHIPATYSSPSQHLPWVQFVLLTLTHTPTRQNCVSQRDTGSFSSFLFIKKGHQSVVISTSSMSTIFELH